MQTMDPISSIANKGRLRRLEFFSLEKAPGSPHCCLQQLSGVYSKKEVEQLYIQADSNGKR